MLHMKYMRSFHTFLFAILHRAPRQHYDYMNIRTSAMSNGFAEGKRFVQKKKSNRFVSRCLLLVIILLLLLNVRMEKLIHKSIDECSSTSVWLSLVEKFAHTMMIYAISVVQNIHIQN